MGLKTNNISNQTKLNFPKKIKKTNKNLG